MKKLLLLVISFILFTVSYSQTVTQRLQKAFQQFETDSQLRHAISSLYVIDAATGKVVFDKNSHIGLAPASTQKIVTAATAFELLGKDYRYKTKIGYDIGVTNGIMKGNLYIEGDGDPTLGSGRWEQTTDSSVLRKIKSVLISNGVRAISGDIWIDDLKMGINPIPDGWIWQDIGNYYGAGARGLNWKENQYDLVLKSAPSPGVLTDVIKTDPVLINYQLSNFIKTGEKGSGDNGYIYFVPYASTGVATGTIPSGISSFTISGSIPNPAKQFGYSLSIFLKSEGFISDNSIVKLYSDSVMERTGVRKMLHVFDSLTSPTIDSMVYWFLRKSINLYGEAFIKTIAAKNNLIDSTDSGVAIVKKYWKDKGLDDEELNLYDGSGLSPLNRITTHALTEVLTYAKTKDWYRNFYNALPEYNGMKMKSGTISDVKGFCGYHKAKDGKEYIFSFLVNNYSGKTAGVVHKMYKVLDELK
jgi:D-alanyl-D-alanine carboxypeptidase/D-alanyl-D-alanine-endopeptidase (penicillin-binding protein 4)